MITELLIGGGIGLITSALKEDKKIKVLDDIQTALDEENYEGVVDLCDDAIKNISDDRVLRIIHYKKALALYFIWAEVDEEDEDRLEEAYNEVENAVSDYGSKYGWEDVNVIYFYLLLYSGRTITARTQALDMLATEYDDKAIEAYKKSTDELFSRFSEFPFTSFVKYENRKVIYIGRDMRHIAGNYFGSPIDFAFTVGRVPDDIIFQSPKPKCGLYVAHPILTDHYYPFESVDEILFMEKIRELRWFTQCLGATQIAFTSHKGIRVEDCLTQNWHTDADVQVKDNHGKANADVNSTRQSDWNKQSHLESVEYDSPRAPVFIPNDLNWYEYDPEWKNIYKSRLAGQLSYHYKISSIEISGISTNDRLEIQGSYEKLMVDINANFKKESDHTFKQTGETEWAVDIQFMPLDDMPKSFPKDLLKYSGVSATVSASQDNDSVDMYSLPFSMPVEDMYTIKGRGTLIEGTVASGRIHVDDVIYLIQGATVLTATVKGCELFERLLEQVEYGDHVRLLLEGVTTEQVEIGMMATAVKPEVKTSTGISSDEQKYLEEVRAVLEDGEIGPRERKALERHRVRLGISEERAEELEASLVTPSFSDDEIKYLEEVKFVLEDGEIGPRERKSLERHRVRLGIAEERAREIEILAER